MIQRLQSIFLFLSSGFFIGEFFSSFARSGVAVAGIFEDQLYNLYDNPMLIVLASLGGLLSLLTIFLYNNRKLQLKLSYAVITCAILLPLIAVLIFKNQSSGLDEVAVDEQIGLYLPIGSILFAALSIRFIAKDEKLVKSMDRLR